MKSIELRKLIREEIKKINEAKKIDKAWALKELMDFNRKSNPTDKDFEHLVVSIINHLGYQVNTRNIDSLTDHLHIIYSVYEKFPKNISIEELYSFLR